MADISQVTLPSGNTYNLKDAWARTQIAAITGGSAIVFKGVSSTALTDGGNENPTISGSAVTSKSTGDLYFYGSEEFIYGDDSKWHSLGESLSQLGALAYKNSGSVNYTKATGVTSTFTGNSNTVSISASTVNTDANYTPQGMISFQSPTFYQLSSTANYTPAGSINGGTFTGTAATIKVSGTPSGTVTQPTFSGASLSSTGSYTPAGTVQLKTAGSTVQIKNPSAVTVAKTLNTSVPSTAVSGRVTNEITYCDVNGENLRLYQVGYVTGNSITTTNTTVKTGDGVYEFVGTPATITTSGTPAGTVSQPTFNGAAATYSGSYTPGGSVSSLSFSGTPATITAKGTPALNSWDVQFVGVPAKFTGSVTPTGSISNTLATTTATANVTFS